LKDCLPELEAGQKDYRPWAAGDEVSEGPVAIAVAGYDAEAFLALSTAAGSARTLSAAQLPGLRAWLEDPSRPKAVHDAKATLVALRKHGIELRGVIDDTLLYAFLLDPTESGYDLDKLA